MSDRQLLIISVTSAVVLLTSVAAVNLVGELPQASWHLLVAFGILGAITVCVASTTFLVLGRLRRRATWRG